MANKANSEAYRLPRGFHDKFGEDFDNECRIILAAKKRGAEIGCLALRTPVIGFSENFKLGRDEFTDRVYSFSDRGDREVMLSPDSTPHIFRWLANRSITDRPNLIFFLSQVFRYRRQKYRSFSQVGYAFYSESSLNINDENAKLVSLIACLFRLMSLDFSITIRVRINDIGLWRNIFTPYLKDCTEISHILKKIRFSKDRNWIMSEVDKIGGLKLQSEVDMMLCNDLTGIKNLGGAFHDSINELFSVRQKILECCGCITEIDISNLRSSETHCGTGFVFVDEHDQVCADGGNYTKYSKEFITGSKSYLSAATGVEYILERIRE